MVKNYLGGAGFSRDDRLSWRKPGITPWPGREPFEAIILDLMLPDMDGLDVCRRIRAPGRHADSDADGRAAIPWTVWWGSEVGADDYLPKPFEAA